MGSRRARPSARGVRASCLRRTVPRRPGLPPGHPAGEASLAGARVPARGHAHASTFAALGGSSVRSRCERSLFACEKTVDSWALRFGPADSASPSRSSARPGWTGRREGSRRADATGTQGPFVSSPSSFPLTVLHFQQLVSSTFQAAFSEGRGAPESSFRARHAAGCPLSRGVSTGLLKQCLLSGELSRPPREVVLIPVSQTTRLGVACLGSRSWERRTRRRG